MHGPVLTWFSWSLNNWLHPRFKILCTTVGSWFVYIVKMLWTRDWYVNFDSLYRARITKCCTRTKHFNFALPKRKAIMSTLKIFDHTLIPGIHHRPVPWMWLTELIAPIEDNGSASTWQTTVRFWSTPEVPLHVVQLLFHFLSTTYRKRWWQEDRKSSPISK